MASEYKFVVKKGKTIKYNNILKAIKSQYSLSDIPIPDISVYNNDVFMTPNKKLYDYLIGIGYVVDLNKFKEFVKEKRKKQDVDKLNKNMFISEEGAFLYNNFAQWIYDKSEHYFVRIRQTDELYYYQGGIYVPYGDTYIEEIIQQKMSGEVIVSSTHVTEIIKYIKRSVLREIDIIQTRSERVACNNGVIDLRTKELFPHSPDNYMFKKIPWDYIPNSVCPEFDNLVNKLLPDDPDKYKLNVMIGYPLINSYIYNKIFFLEGKAGSGKSTFTNILQPLYGIENTSNINLHDLIEEPFMRVGLIDSYANFSGDASNEPIEDASILKTLSGESRLSINVKNLRMPIKLMNTSKLIVDTNDMPEFNLTDDAIFRRLIKITFSVIVPEEDKTSDYMDKLLTREEMEGLLVVAVESAHLILTGDNPFKSTSIADSKEEYENARINIVDKFISKHIQIYPDGVGDEHIIIQPELWQEFKMFCDFMGVDSSQRPKVRSFYKSFILKCDIDEPESMWISELKTNKKCYKGVKLINIVCQV